MKILYMRSGEPYPLDFRESHEAWTRGFCPIGHSRPGLSIYAARRCLDHWRGMYDYSYKLPIDVRKEYMEWQPRRQTQF